MAWQDHDRESVAVYPGFEPIAAEWDSLADRVDAGPWDRPDWISAWLDAFGRGAPYLVALRRGAELAGVLPLEEVNGALRTPTNWHTPSFGGVFADAEAATTLAEVAFSLTRRHLELSFVDTGSVLAKALEGLGEWPSVRTHSRVIQRAPYLALPDTAEEFEATLSAKRRSGLRRIRRRLAKLGEMSFTVSDGSDRLDDLLAEGFDVERSGWKGEQGTAICSQPSTLQFYTKIAQRFARRGWLRLAFLRLDGRPTAFDFAAELAGKHYLVKTGYLETLRSWAPGVALRHEMILRSIAGGCGSYEFLGCDAPWKREWTHSSHERLQVQAFHATVPGRADYLLRARALPVARRARELLAR